MEAAQATAKEFGAANKLANVPVVVPVEVLGARGASLSRSGSFGRMISTATSAGGPDGDGRADGARAEQVAEASPERLFCHVYGRGKGQAQMIPGWPYSVIAALEPVPPIVLVLAGATSIQFGAGLARCGAPIPWRPRLPP